MKRIRDELNEYVFETLREAQQKVSDRQGKISEGVELTIANGCPRLALDLIQDNLTQLSFPNPGELPDPRAYAVAYGQAFRLNLIHIRSLLMVGRTQEAWEAAERLRQDLEAASQTSQELAVRQELLKMQHLVPLAGYANLAADRMDIAAELWSKYGNLRLKLGLDTALASLPGLSLPPQLFDRAAAYHLGSTTELQYVDLPEWEQSQFQLALCELEQGRNGEATTILRQLIDSNPDGPLRRHAAFYLTLLTGAQISLDGPARTAATLAAEQAAARQNSRPPSPSLPQKTLIGPLPF